jgi:carbon monoxide dehydrogenase subunit G
MHLEKEFVVDRSPEQARHCCSDDAALLDLFPDTRSEIVESRGDRRTVRTHYEALGQQGSATFHFDFVPGDDIHFEKVCDGRVWRELKGRVSFEAKGSGTRVKLSLDGRTKPLVPEFTIKGAMQDQLDQMARALRQRLAGA